MKKIVKTLLIVFMIVLLVFPKSLAVELGNIVSEDNTNSDSTDTNSNVETNTLDVNTNVESNDQEATDTEITDSEVNKDVETNTSDDVNADEESNTSDVDVETNDTVTNQPEEIEDLDEMLDVEIVEPTLNKKTKALRANMSDGLVLMADNVWRLIKNGQVDYTYNGLASNEYGMWYIENGIITFKYNGTAVDNDGNIWIVKSSKVQTDLTKVMEVNGIWRMVINGKVEKNYRGIGTNENGTWYLENGTIDFRYTGTYEEGDKSYIIEKSMVQATLNKNISEVVEINKVWRMVINGQIDYNYTGMGSNQNGMWYLENGTISFKYNGTAVDSDGNIWIVKGSKVQTDLTKVMEVNGIWRMVINGKIEKDYRGIGTNENGTWYLENGTIDFRYTGTYEEGDKSYIIEKSMVQATLNKNISEVVEINKVWRMVINGQIDYNYTGIGSNQNGMWYIENGTISFKYNGTAVDSDGNIWIVKGSKVQTDLTKVMEINGIWRMVINGKIEKDYTGIGTNENGTWYLENGTIDFTYTGTKYGDGKIYTIVKGLVTGIKEGTISKVTKITAKAMEKPSKYYCEDNNVVGTIVATDKNGKDSTSLVTNLSCDVTGAYEQDGITDANSGVTVKVELNRNTGKYEIKLNAVYPGNYTITPNATGDVVDSSLEKEAITVRVEDKETVNKIKLINTTTGEDLANNTLELYSNQSNNYGIKVEFYHSYKNIEREVPLSRTADVITFGKPGEPFSVALCDAYQSPVTGKNNVETLYVATAEVSEQKEGKITIQVEDGKAELTVKAKPVGTQGLIVNGVNGGGEIKITLPLTADGALNIPIELKDELNGNKTITEDMIVNKQISSASGNIAIYIKNATYSNQTSRYLTISYDNASNIQTLTLKLTTSGRNNAATIFGQGIVFEYDTPTGRKQATLMPTNLN